MTDWIVEPCISGLRGVVRLPSDKSIGHRAIMLAALADGVSTLRRISMGEDNKATLAAFELMGVPHEIFDSSTTTNSVFKTVRIHGVGLFGLKPPIDHKPIPCGNSGTTMRLLMGLLCAQNFDSILIGDESLSRRPMRRVLEPLRQRGAHCHGVKHPKKEDETAPITITAMPDDRALTSLSIELPIPSAQVKSALLLSGLYAHGVTEIQEPLLSRDHTERMFVECGLPIKASGSYCEFDPAGWDGVIRPLDMTIPGDLSAAAFVLVAANLIQGSSIRIVDVGINPTRSGILDVLRAMRASFQVIPKGEQGREPIATLEVHSVHEGNNSSLIATSIGGELIVRSVDEIPVLCVAAACAKGTTTIRDASELRVKESDRVTSMAYVLKEFGIDVEEFHDGLSIQGLDHSTLKQATIESKGDHRIAMSAALLALRANGTCIIRDVDCVATSFPYFAQTLRQLGASIHEN